MRLAADFRGIAREMLKGKWTVAVLAGLAATILGAAQELETKVKFHIDISNFGYVAIAALIIVVLYFIVGSAVAIGYAKFNLDLTDRQEVSFAVLFSYFSYWSTAAAARFLKSIYVLLWSLLLVIPGIVASYSYAMTEYILADCPELSASEAVSRSKQMMEGNKWRLFCLMFSFIGWDILCAFTFGIGTLWLTPYKQAAKAAFYREVSGTERSSYQNEWNWM